MLDKSDSQVFLNDVRGDLCHCDDAFDYWGKGTSVTVTSAVHGPPKSLFPVWECGSTDSLVTLGCITRDLATGDGLSYIWKDESGNALTNVVQYPPVQSGGKYTSVSTARVSAADWNQRKKFTCEARNSAGSIEVSQGLKVLEQHASLLLTAPIQTELDNGTASFVCLAAKFSPSTNSFTWTRQGIDLNKHVKPTILSKDQSTYTAISVLEISAHDWVGSSNPIKCEFKQKTVIGSKEVKYESDHVKEATVSITPPPTKDILIKRYGELKCTTDNKPSFKNITWFNGGGQQIAAEEKKEGSKITLSTRISLEEWTNGTEFICEVVDSDFIQGFKKEVFQRVNGKMDFPKAYLLPPPDSSESSVTLTCYVTDFYPEEVAMSWLVGDICVDDSSNYEQNTTSLIEKTGLFSVYSQLTVSKSEWESGTVFTCRVYHESIEDPVRLISRSMTSQSSPSTLVNLSLNVPSSCCAATY